MSGQSASTAIRISGQTAQNGLCRCLTTTGTWGQATLIPKKFHFKKAKYSANSISVQPSSSSSKRQRISSSTYVPVIRSVWASPSTPPPPLRPIRLQSKKKEGIDFGHFSSTFTPLLCLNNRNECVISFLWLL